MREEMKDRDRSPEESIKLNSKTTNDAKSKIYFPSDYYWQPTDEDWREMALRIKIKGTNQRDRG